MPRLMLPIRHKLRQPIWLLTSSLLAAVCVAAAVTMALGVPVPRIHDEFAYLLGADTYANGRIVNPAHVHWQHFETFHVLTNPVYLPKYPPGQSLIMAFGQLLGHPHIGVCLSTGLAAASLAWMLVAWLPARFSWLAWLVAVLHPGLQIKWGHSYMGGAVGMIGACLLLGALGHSRRRLSAIHSAVAALGIVILAISRPFEGAVLTTSVALSLLVMLWRSGRWKVPQLLSQLIVPGGVVLTCGAAAIIFNNLCVTGRASQLPYQLYESQYGLIPLFVWQSPKAQPPSYRHAIMQRYYQSEQSQAQAKSSTPLVLLREKTQSLLELVHFFGGGAQYMLLLGLPLALRRWRYRLAFGLLIPVLLASVATPWTLTHYAAPAAPLIILVILAGLIEISRLNSLATSAVAKKASHNSKLSSALAAISLLMLLLHGWTLFRNDRRANQIPWALRRQAIQQQLSQQPGKHLVLVRYTTDHNSHEEWVYNLADIDKAAVVWARQISSAADAGLVSYFADRKVHIIEADQ